MTPWTQDTLAQAERQRIRLEYERRDRDESLRRQFRLTEPAFLFHMQEREWAIVNLLRREGLSLEGRRVLEVGCGDGHILQRFLDFGAAEAVGVDLMWNRVQSARSRFPNVRALVGDAMGLPLANASFDLVIQFMCISSVLDPGGRQMIGQEMWRVLRPGGVILSYDMRTMPALSRPLRIMARPIRRPLRALWRCPTSGTDGQAPRATPVMPLDPEEIRRLFAGDCRLTTVSLRGSLARSVIYGRWLPLLLSACPLLRTHHLALIRKPKPGSTNGAAP